MDDHDNRRPTYDGPLTKDRDPLEIRADAEKGLLTGYASKFWAIDSYAEATAPGAFQQTVADRGPQGANRIILRYEHEHTIGTHTKMAEDADGLAIEAKVSDDGQWGSAVRAHLSDGVPYGLSIGFRRQSDRTAEDSDPLDFSSAPEWAKTLPRNEIRILTGVKLMENSVVSFPAVDPATVDSYRSLPDDFDIAEFVARLDAAKRAELLTYLAQASELPADGPGGSETPAPRVTQTARRTRDADLTILLTALRRQGIGVQL